MESNKVIVMSVRMDRRTYGLLTALAKRERRPRVDFLRCLIQDLAAERLTSSSGEKE